MWRSLMAIICMLGSFLFANVDRACHKDRIFIGPEYQWREWGSITTWGARLEVGYRW